MIKPQNPEVWSDFDGTGVIIAKKHNPRNWLKYPLPMIDGYADFLRGVQSGGVEIAGIVSRRPAIRRTVTARSIAQLGLDEFFPGKHQVVLSGSETKKARHLVDRSEDRLVALVDDKPHRIGQELIDALAQTCDVPSADQESHRQVILGAVHHSKSEEYFAKLGEHVAARDDVGYATNEQGLHIRGSMFDLLVVQVEPYSHEAGLAFAREVDSSI